MSSLFGEENRTTKDMDATLKGVLVNKEMIEKVISEILLVDVKDDITFKIVKIKEIIEHHLYEGYRISIKAIYDKIRIDLSIDISTGDKITPREIKYKYKSVVNEESYIIMSYPIETILAEKFETIITRTASNTRMKDFYDVYMIMKLYNGKLNNKNVVKAIENTFINRGNRKFLSNLEFFINEIENSGKLEELWRRYVEEHPFANEITFDCLILEFNKIKEIINCELIVN